jgi:hypothetical protein
VPELHSAPPFGIRTLSSVAATKNATPAQIDLAWLLARKPFIVSIPGTRNIDHLRENLGALDVQLTTADPSALDADFSKLTVHGGRMNEMQMRAVEQAGQRTNMRIGILGSGLMGGKLGTIFAKAGHDVVFSYARSQRKLNRLARQAGRRAVAGTPREAAEDADVLILAVHWSRVNDVLKQAGDLSGKVLITCSLPMNASDTALAIAHTSSGAEALAKKAKRARVVSAFGTVPSEVLFDVFEARRRRTRRRPSLLYCGNDDAKRRAPLVEYWKAQNGQQSGDPAKLARALITIASQKQPPRRFIAGADAIATAGQKIADLKAQIEAHRELSTSLAFD